jgi:hypothetical protein
MLSGFCRLQEEPPQVAMLPGMRRMDPNSGTQAHDNNAIE